MGRKLFSLYLRSFSTTNAFITSFEHFHYLSWDRISAASDYDVERLLQLGVDKNNWGPLIALGNPGEHIGAGRAKSTEATWKDDIALLCKEAHSILVMPAPNNGTLWEIEHITCNYFLHKTIFVVPPIDTHFYRSRGIEAKEFIDKTMEACSLLSGLTEEHLRFGALFSIRESRKIGHVEFFPDPKVSLWASALSRCRCT